MNSTTGFIAMVFSLSLLSTPVLSQTLTFYGNATDPESGERLYQEVHRLTLDETGRPVSETVDYVGPEGELLGQKFLDYQSLSQPDYRVEFKSKAYPEIVAVEADTITVKRQEDKRLSVPDDAFAIDGGFHYFIQENFDALASGNNVDFQFLSAGRGSFIPLSIAPVDQSENQLTLELRLQNFFLSRIVQPIVLTYDLSTRQLASYNGLTNVPDGEGDLYSALISYQYPDSMVSVALPPPATVSTP